MKIAQTYSRTAYLARRMRVDSITLDFVIKPVAEMYTRQTRIDLETVRVLPKGLRMVREFNREAVTARTKAATVKAAQAGKGDQEDGAIVLFARSKKASAAAAKKAAEEAVKNGTNSTLAPDATKPSPKKPGPVAEGR